MENKSLPQFFAFQWESTCIFMALPISLALFLNSSILGTSDFFTLLITQINVMSFLALITSFFKDWKKGILALPVLLLILFNIEHILINEANLNFLFFGLGKSDAFRDSLFTITFFTHTLYFATSLMISLIVSHFFKLNKVFISLIFFSSLIFQLLTPITPLRPNWVNQNFVIENLGTLFKAKPQIISVKSLERNDEKGISFIPKQRKEPKNIILIILEGFSQFHIEANYLPHLRSLQNESFVLNQFVSHQKQTNRGLFSILCGRLPNQREFQAKSDLIVSNFLKPKCLPSFLKDLGYENTFLQSAPLAFMAKDRFARNIGYDYAIGALSFEKDKLISSWGVADEDIFSASLKLLENNKNKQFLTLLTANTHHPYKTSKGRMTFQQAITHIDTVVKSYIEEIKKRDLYKDSLIIITSDEAFQSEKGLPLHYDNWGIFMALSDELPVIKKEQVFGQRNIMDSVLHFLKIPRENKARSFFKNYKSDEGIAFSNIFQKRAFYFYPPHRLLICNFDENCILKRTTKNLFSFLGNSTEDHSLLKSSLDRIITSSDKSFHQNKIVLSLTDISLKAQESKVLISEYKINSKKKRIILNSSEKIESKVSAYICGNPNSMMEWTLKKGVFELPEAHLNKDLCLTLGLKNKTPVPVNIKRLELHYE